MSVRAAPSRRTPMTASADAVSPAPASPAIAACTSASPPDASPDQRMSGGRACAASSCIARSRNAAPSAASANRHARPLRYPAVSASRAPASSPTRLNVSPTPTVPPASFSCSRVTTAPPSDWSAICHSPCPPSLRTARSSVVSWRSSRSDVTHGAEAGRRRVRAPADVAADDAEAGADRAGHALADAGDRERRGRRAGQQHGDDQQHGDVVGGGLARGRSEAHTGL